VGHPLHPSSFPRPPPSPPATSSPCPPRSGGGHGRSSDGGGHGESGDNDSSGDEVGLLLLLLLDLLFRVQTSLSPFIFPNSCGLRRKDLGEGRPTRSLEALTAVERSG